MRASCRNRDFFRRIANPAAETVQPDSRVHGCSLSSRSAPHSGSRIPATSSDADSGRRVPRRTESYAAFDVQRAGAGAGHRRSVPDEHAFRRAAARLAGRLRPAPADRPAATPHSHGDERDTIDVLIENGFVVESREHERRSLDEYFTNVREDTEQMKVTVLTTLQCNFACDYCFQGDHGDYNKFAAKMSLDTARRGGALDRAAGSTKSSRRNFTSRSSAASRC